MQQKIEEPTAKVLFRIPDEEGGADVETLWAFDLGGSEYRLDNLPFFAYSVSWNDEVFAPFEEEEGFPVFQRVVRKSGNRTIRIIFESSVVDGDRSQQLLQGLVDLGCGYEGASKTFIAVNIPRHSDFSAVVDYLTENDIRFEYADPSYDELYPDIG